MVNNDKPLSAQAEADEEFDRKQRALFLLSGRPPKQPRPSTPLVVWCIPVVWCVCVMVWAVAHV